MNLDDPYTSRYGEFQYGYPSIYGDGSESVLTVSATPSMASAIPWLIIAAWLLWGGGRSHY